MTIKGIITTSSISIIFVLFYSSVQSQYRTTINIENRNINAPFSTIERNTSNLLHVICQAYFNKQANIRFNQIPVTDSAKKLLNTIFSSNAFRCSATRLTCKLFPLGNNAGFQIRNIPIRDTMKSEQNIHILYDRNGMITDVLFSNDKYFVNSKEWMPINSFTLNPDSLTSVDPEKALYYRRVIFLKNFLENFRTAYNRKDLRYLNEMYSDDAVIISGKVLIKTNAKKYETLSDVIYTVSDKATYFKRLESVFSKNEYIDIKFDSIEIGTHELKDYQNYFGTSLIQHWNSSTYNDVGNLFLLIKFDPGKDDLPVIHLRVWQKGKKFDMGSIDTADLNDDYHPGKN